MIKGKPSFAPWQDDPDPPDYWDDDDYEAMRVRLRAYWGGTPLDDTWDPGRHPRNEEGEFASVITVEEETPEAVGKLGRIAVKSLEALSATGEQYRGTRIKAYTTQGETGIFIENAQRLIKSTGKYQKATRSYRLRVPFKIKTMSHDAIREWNEEKHSRVQGGATGGQFGTGTGPMTARKEKSGRATAAIAGRHKEHVQGERAKAQEAQQQSMQAEAAAQAQEVKAKEDQTAAKKGKKVSRKEDFDKAGVRIRGVTSEHETFIAKWNDKIGIDPAEFEKMFTGGLQDRVDLSVGMSGSEIQVSGTIKDERGNSIGNFDRDIKPDKNEAYSAYFKLEKAATGDDTGKRILGGNIETYEAMGIDTVKVTANIDVGGYAWAKYGYVPTASAWSTLSGDLERKLDRETEEGPSGSRHRRSSGDTYEADDWDMLSSDQQEETQRRWMRDSRDEFVQSEIESWRDSGRPKEEAKKEIVSDWSSGDNDWALDKLKELRKERLDKAKEGGEEIKDFALNDEQILGALTIDDYESRYEDGGDDPEWTWDDATLAAAGELKAKGQMELPGIEPPDYSKILSDKERTEITDALTDAFNAKAEEDESDIDPPDYLSEQVEEYQDEYWSQKDNAEKLSLAIDYGQADIEVESEDDGDQEEMDLTEEEKQSPEVSELYDLVRSGDPKSIWKIADSSMGKKLLLGSGWSGVLNLKDPESYARFKAYVGKRKS